MHDCDSPLPVGDALDIADAKQSSGHAQECFLKSTCPAAALTMRVDLGHWAAALRLAPALDPSLIPHLTSRHAQVSYARPL